MPETLAQEQRRTKPRLEDIIASRSNMSGEAKQVALALLDYCNAKNITYRWSSTNRWNLMAKSKSIGYIGIGIRETDDDLWHILLNHRDIVQYEDFFQNEGLAEFIHGNLHFCEGCKGVCVSCSGKLGFTNPNMATIENLQKILDFMLALSHGTASRPILAPETDGLTRINNKICVSKMSDFQGSSNENMSNLFDCKYGSYFYAGPYKSFMSTGNCHTIEFELDKPTELRMYSLVTGLRVDTPSQWALYGSASKDGEWILLDTQDEFPKPVTLYTEKAFKIDAPGTYQNYRITFEGRNFVVSQIHLYTKSQ